MYTHQDEIPFFGTGLVVVGTVGTVVTTGARVVGAAVVGAAVGAGVGGGGGGAGDRVAGTVGWVLSGQHTPI
jgi:hypothetical protein